jgi:hypothetical protein
LTYASVNINQLQVDFSSVGSLRSSTLEFHNGGKANLDNVTNITGASILVDGGVTVSLPNVTQYSHGSTDINQQRYLSATGIGSVLDLSNVTTITGGTHRYSGMHIDAVSGGSINLSSVVQIEDPNSGDTRERRINVTSDGVSSQIDLSSLDSFVDRAGWASSGDGLWSSMVSRNGGTLTTPNLRTLANVALTIGSTSNQLVPELTSFSGGKLSLGGVQQSFPNLVSLTYASVNINQLQVDFSSVGSLRSSTLEFHNGGKANLDNVTNIDNSSIYVAGGVTLSLPGVTQYSHASTGNSQYRTLRATGVGSVLDLSNVTTITGGTHYDSRVLVEAIMGGVVDLSGVTRIEDPDSGDTRWRRIDVTSDGAYSSIDLTNLVSFLDRRATSSSGDNIWSTLAAIDSGTVILSQAEFTGVQITSGENARILGAADLLANSRLIGNGRAGTVDNAGTVAPSGILTLQSDYLQSTQGRLTVRVGGTAAGSGFDRLAVEGDAAIGGTLELVKTNSFVPTLGAEFLILSAHSVAGVFNNVIGAAFGNNIKLQPEIRANGVYLKAVADFGPKVIGTNPQGEARHALSAIDVAFDEPILWSSVNAGQIQLTGPSGVIAITNLTQPTPSSIRVHFASQTQPGNYLLNVGPNIQDLAGNQMDQNGNGTGGEAGDVFSTTIELLVPSEPVVLSQTPSGVITTAPQTITLQFSVPLDPDSARDPNNYVLTHLGSNQVFGGSDDQQFAVTPNYTEGALTVSLTPSNFPQGLPDGIYRLQIRSGATGVRNVVGGQLDGNDDGVPGDDYLGSFSVSTVTASVSIGLSPTSDSGLSTSDRLTNVSNPTFAITVNQIGLLEFDPLGNGVFTQSTYAALPGQFSFTHQYTSDGGYSPAIRFRPSFGSLRSSSTTFTLDRAAPTLLVGATPQQAPVLSRSVQFSEPITTSDGSTTPGTLAAILIGPNNQQINIRGVSGSGANYVFTLDPLFVPGQYELRFTDQIFDVAGNRVLLPPVDSFMVLPDVTAPFVTAFVPLGPTNQNTNSLRITFSEPMNPASFTAAQVSIQVPQGVAPIQVSSVSLVPGSDQQFEILLASSISVPGDYTVSIAASVADLSGNTLGSPYSAGITIDRTGPRIISAVPVGTQNQIITFIDVTFDSNIVDSTFRNNDIALTGPAGAVSVSHPYRLSGNTFRIPITAQRSNGTYQLTVGPNILDLAGNPMDQNANGIAGEPTVDAFTHSFVISLPNLSVDNSITITSSTGTPLTEVQFGQPFNIGWTTSNTGTFAALGAIRDRVWLSTNASLSGDDLPLGAFDLPSSNTLGAGGNFQGSLSAAVPLLPSSTAGTYYLLIQTDALGSIVESNENDNLRAIAINLVLPPLPDLVASSILPPQAILPGTSVELSWQVGNVGTASAVGPWMERVYLSNDAAGSNRQLLASYTRQGSIDVGSVPVVRNETLFIPTNSLNGDVYFLVEVDAGNALLELDEQNLFASDSTRNIPAILGLSFSSSSLNEGGSSIEVTVTRNGDVQNPLNVALSGMPDGRLVLPASVTIPAGQYIRRFNISALNDTVYHEETNVLVTASANGFPAVSRSIQVIDNDLPTLSLTLPSSQMNEGDEMTVTVTRNFVSSQDRVLTLAVNTPQQLTAPATITLPAGQSSVSFVVVAVDDLLIEPDTMHTLGVSAAGHIGDSKSLTILASDIPTLGLELPTALTEGAQGPSILGRVSRDPVTSQAVDIQLTSADPTQIVVPAVVRIPAGQSSVYFPVQVLEDELVNGDRVVHVTASALPTQGGPALSKGSVSQPITILDNDGLALSITLDRASVGEGFGATAIIRRNSIDLSQAVTITLTTSPEGQLNVPKTVIMPSGAGSVTVDIQGIEDGLTDGNQLVTLLATAENYLTGSSTIVVTDTDLPDLDIVALEPSRLTAVTGELLDVSWTIANSGYTPALGTWTQRVFLSDDAMLGNDVLAGQYTYTGPLTEGDSYNRTVGVRMPNQPGSYWLVLQADVANTVDELLESNNSRITALPIVVSSAYTATVWTAVETAPANTPVLIQGTAVNLDNSPATFKQVSVHLTVRGTRRILPAITDGSGNFSLTFTPLPAEGGRYTIGAAHPGEATAPVQDEFLLVGMRAEPPAKSISINEAGAAASDTLLIRNLADLPLTGIVVEVLGAPANLQVSATLVGSSTTIEPNGTLSLSYSVSANDASTTSGTFQLRILSKEAPAITVPISFTVVPLVSRLIANPGSLNKSMLVGSQTSVEFTVTNTGGLETGPIQVLLPSGAGWLTLSTPANFPSLDPGASTSITLLLTPPENLPLTAYNGSLVVRSEDNQVSIPFSFRAVSEETGELQITVVDEYFYFTDEKPLVKTATINLRDPFNGALVASSTPATQTMNNDITITVDEDGRVTFSGVPEGPYTLEVRSDDHEPYTNSIRIDRGTLSSRQVFVTRNTVQYTWTVEQTEIEDRTNITINANFETNVPMPVVVMQYREQGQAGFKDGAVFNLEGLDHIGQSKQVDIKLTNYGLIAAEDVALVFDNNPYYEFLPLVPNIGTLSAGSEVIVPVIVRRIGNFEDAGSASEDSSKGGPRAQGGPCIVIYARVEWVVVCGVPVLKWTPIAVINYPQNCPTSGGGGYDPGPGPNTGEDGPESVWPTPVSRGQPDVDCAECVEDSWTLTLSSTGIVNQAVQAAAGFLKIAPIVENVEFGLSGEASWETCCEDEVEVGSKLRGEGAGSGTLGFKIPIVGGELELGEDVGIPVLPLPPGTQFDFEIEAGLFFTGEVELAVFGAVETACYDWWDWTLWTGSAGVRGSAELTLELSTSLEIDLEIPGYEEIEIIASLAGGLRGKVEGTAELQYSSSGISYDWEVIVGAIELFGRASFTVSDTLSNILGIPEGIELEFEVTLPVFDGFKWSKEGTNEDASPNKYSAPGRLNGLTNPATGEKFDTSIASIIDLEHLATDVGFANTLEMIEELNLGASDLTTIPNEDWQGIFDAINQVYSPETSEPGVCAHVQLQIDHQAIQTRQAFKATLEIDNGLNNALFGIGIDISIKDVNGNDTSSLFGILDPSLSAITSVNGAGFLAAETIGSAQWTIIPSTEAATNGSMQYFVSGTLRYIDGVNEVTIPLAPTSIIILPQPELTLKYFMQRDVISDDPHTPEVEPAEPFTLAVQVQNNGFGDARNLRIESAQPRIIENERGLLIDFTIVGTRINGQEVQNTLTANFGTIAAGDIGIAEWLFESSLQGLFIDYSATFEHQSPFGDNRFSLIKSVEIRELIRSVNAAQVDGDDGLPDFLVNDLPDPQDLPDTLYLSDGSVASVALGSNANIGSTPTISNLRIPVTAQMNAGWSYLKMNDPSLGNFQLIAIERSDGTTLPAKNFWQTDRTFIGGGLQPILENKIHLLDHNSTGSYTFVFSNGDFDGPEIISFAGASPNPTTQTIDFIDIQFNEPLNLANFNPNSLRLTKNGVTVSTPGLTVSASGNNTYRVSGLAAFTSEDAVYELFVDLSQLTDVVGNSGSGIESYRWIRGETLPTIMSLAGAPSGLTNSVIDSVDVVFSKPIIPASFGLDDISLLRDGTEVVDSQVTIAQLGPTTYRIGNLARLVGTDAEYRLTVNAAGVQDTGELWGIGDAVARWTLDATAPILVNLFDPPTNPRNIVVQQIDVQFSEAIDVTTLDVGDLTLVRDSGTENLLAGDPRVTFEYRGNNRYRIGGINWVQAFLANPQVADFTFTINASGISDLAGNASSGVFSSTWTIDLDKPLVPTNLKLFTFSGEVVGGRLNSRFATITGDTAEPGLTISILDITTNTELARSQIVGNSFSLPIVFPSAGQHRLRVRAIDPAGNVAEAFVENLFIEEAAPLVQSVEGLPQAFTNQPLSDVTLRFVTPINPATLTPSALTLTRNSGANLVGPGVVISPQADGRTFVISGLSGLTESEGFYSLSLDLTSVVSTAGLPGSGQLLVNWTTDRVAPVSQMQPLDATQTRLNFIVRAVGTDPAISGVLNGSGIVSYDIYVSENGAKYQLYQTLPSTAASTLFTGRANTQYSFYSLARDAAGNVELAPSQPDTTTFVPDVAPATVGDRVWIDTNANGIQDPDEIGKAGVVVRVYLAGQNVPLAQTVTDSQGLYSFSDLSTGESYFLEFVAPSGFAWTTANAGGNDALDSDVDLLTGRTAVFSVLTGINDQWDAGLVELGAVAGLAWLDINANGLRDANELILPGQTIFLDLNNNGQLDTGEPLSVTNSLGSFTFTDLRPAQYSVRMVAPKGWEITYPTSSGGGAGLHLVTLQSGQTRDDLDFGAKPIVVEPARVLGSFVQHAGYTGSGSPIDTGKMLAKEGSTPQLLTYDNLINSARGINSLVFDLENLPRMLSSSDFVFQMSPQGAFDQSANPPSSWQEAPAPSSVTVAAGFPSRVTVRWSDNAITNRWFRISILANENTGLAETEVYYIGHLLGEISGAVNGMFTVSFADISAVRAVVGSAADASSIYDIDKNGVISFADISALRQNIGTQLPALTIGVPAIANIVGSYVYHGGYSGLGSPIDPGKSLAKEGVSAQTLTFDNLINTTRGINGIALDIQSLPAGTLSAADFVFQMSPTGAFDQTLNPPSGWQTAPSPSSISVTPGSPSRVLIQWPDNAIANRWLRLTVLANARTGLVQPEVYYLGHLAGEVTGDTDGLFTVSFLDISGVRSKVGSSADASSVYDLDKNGIVSMADVTTVRQNLGRQLTAITIPGASPLRLSSRVGDFRTLAPVVDHLMGRLDNRQNDEKDRASEVDQLFGLLDESETALEVNGI